MWDLFVKNIIISFHWFHLNNYTPYEKLNSSCGVHHERKFHLRTDPSCDMQCSRALDTQLPCVIAEHAIHHVIVMDGWSFGQSQ